MREARISNRVIQASGGGWEYEANQRHLDLRIQETGAHGMSVLTHPGGERKTVEEEEQSAEMLRTGDQVQSGCCQGELSGSR